MTQQAVTEQEVPTRDLPVNEADEAALGGGQGATGSPGAQDGPEGAVDLRGDGLPAWARMALPEGTRVPEEAVPYAMLLRAKRTQRPSLGDRVVVVWRLGVRDERNARARVQASGEGANAAEEYALTMVRAVDGRAINLAVDQAMMARFWDDIGSAYRNLLTAWYLQTHQMSDQDRADFFGQCVVPLKVG